MSSSIAIIGFGEAAGGFAAAWPADVRAAVRAYDVKTDDPATAAAKWNDYARLGVSGAPRAAEAAGGAALLLSLVTADQALAAASSVAPALAPGALYCDFNSVAPATKQAAARIIHAAGGRYADVAVMAPVRPPALAVPLLVSGEHAAAAITMLTELGFGPRGVGRAVGDAAAVKMLRSVMVKGMEALSAECFVAASAAGLTAEVAVSLGDSWPGFDWTAQADYNLERMMVHGARRAAEMDEAAATLASLGCDPTMARATAAAQRRIGSMRLQPVSGLDAKSGMILGRGSKAA